MEKYVEWLHDMKMSSKRILSVRLVSIVGFIAWFVAVSCKAKLNLYQSEGLLFCDYMCPFMRSLTEDLRNVLDALAFIGSSVVGVRERPLWENSLKLTVKIRDFLENDPSQNPGDLLK
jgi:hypothetical protein